MCNIFGGKVAQSVGKNASELDEGHPLSKGASSTTVPTGKALLSTNGTVGDAPKNGTAIEKGTNATGQFYLFFKLIIFCLF